jgi:hypothetical protein
MQKRAPASQSTPRYEIFIGGLILIKAARLTLYQFSNLVGLVTASGEQRLQKLPLVFNFAHIVPDQT